MTKMAAMSIYDKNPSKIFSEISRPMTVKLGIQYWGPTNFIQMLILVEFDLQQGKICSIMLLYGKSFKYQIL